MWTGYLERSKIHLDGGDGRKIGNPRVYHSQVRPLRIYGSGLREKLLTRSIVNYISLDIHQTIFHLDNY